MEGSVSLTGPINELEARLSALTQTDTKVKSIVRTMGGMLMTEMQKQAHFHRYPYKWPDTPEPTGALKDSIIAQYYDGGLSVKVGPHMYYEGYVEFGTRQMRAEPYVRPALNIIKPEFLAVMKAVV